MGGLDFLLPYKRFLGAYYVMNTLILWSFVWVRTSVLDLDNIPQLTGESEQLGLPRETQFMMMLMMILMLKYRRATTVDGYVSVVFMYTKVYILGICWYSDKVVGCWYLVAYLVAMLALHQPEYEGETAVTVLREYDFETQVENDKSGAFTLVEFYTTWASNCANFTALYADLSLRYSSPNLKFVKIDVGLAEKIAGRYNVNLDPMTTKQLPTLMLFQYGKYMAPHRLPPINEEGVVSAMALTEYNINIIFELEARRMQKPAKSSTQKAPLAKTKSKKKKK